MTGRLSQGSRGARRGFASAALVCLVAGALLSAVPSADGQIEPDERGLWEIWQLKSASPEDHAAVVAACAAFSGKREQDPLNRVADTLAAWHLLKQGKSPEATALFDRHVGAKGSPIGRGAAIVAASWLTRMDRERVKTALQYYYRKEIGYPRTLRDLAAFEALPKGLAPPYKDRWDRAWSYRLVGLKTLPGLLDQKYELQAQDLGSGSDLADALTLDYGERIEAKAVGMRSTTPGHEVVDMVVGPRARDDAKPGGRTSLASIGMWTEGVYLAYVGKRILLVCDRYHWKVLVKPAGP